MAVQAVRTVSFQVTGASLTNQARDLMKEGDWKKALEVLMDGLEGMTYEYAIAILEGHSRLEGANSDVTLVAEDETTRQELQVDYNENYGMSGFLKFEGRMYQAYRVIDNLGVADCSKLYQLQEVISGDRLCPGWLDNPGTVHEKACRPRAFSASNVETRAKFYASRQESDIGRMVQNKLGRWVVVLFEEVTAGITPFWRAKEESAPQKAYDTIAGYLPVWGYRQMFGDAAANESIEPGEALPQPNPESEKPDPTQEELAQQAAAFEAEWKALREKVIAFADADDEYGWHTFKYVQPGRAPLVLRAPKRAAICYALSTTAGHHLMPKYEPLSPSGLKLDEDNPYHTDVWLGCGFDIDKSIYDRDNPAYHAVLDMTFDLQKSLLNFEVHVLAGGVEVTGKVVYADSEVIDKDCILVISNAGVEFEVQALKAGAVICETGGKLAHLVTVCRELSKPIIRMPDARQQLKEGQRITVMPKEGKIEMHPGYRGIAGF